MSRRLLREAYVALDQAQSQLEWQEAARARDALTGADAWRAADQAPLLDDRALRDSLARVRAARQRHDHQALGDLLHQELSRHLPDLVAPELYGVALSGPPLLVEQYLDEAEAGLRWLASSPQPGLSRQQLLARWETIAKVFGRSALLLSGGATLGFHHLGVVAALHKNRLLPPILSGSSTGAMIAAGVGARNDGELDDMLADTSQLRFDGLLPVGLRRAWRDGAWLDPTRLYEVLLHNVGDRTFAEAHAHSGRALNISVSPTRRRQKPRLLTHLTAPDVLVASAALASSALPLVFPPVALQARSPGGEVAPWLPDERWVDGSLAGDLPKLRLSRLHNVNHFIVSQTNPHVLPFVRHHGQRGIFPALSGLVSATVRTQGAWATDSFRRISRPVGPLGRFGDLLHGLVSQDYSGDINLHPQLDPGLLLRVMSNPSPADVARFMLEGQRSVWPLLPMIRNQTRISRVFAACLAMLRRGATGSLSADPA